MGLGLAFERVQSIVLKDEGTWVLNQRQVLQREWKNKSLAPSGAGDLEATQKLVEVLEKETGLSPLTLKVCLSRGLSTAQAIQEFLSPKLETLSDPTIIQDMGKAVQRLVQVRASGEALRIYGDYDVDGTTGSALLLWTFKEFGFKNVDAKQPDRFKDGYGLGVKAVEEAHDQGVRVLVTVDCGITSFDAGLKAKELGIDLIVVDHHQVDPLKGLPMAYAVVNPQRSDCPSGLKQLCGCGLAFYLARALRAEGRKLAWWQDHPEPNLKQHLDLVVLATAADMVPLTGDNHALVRHGLDVLKKTKKPGVRALLTAAGIGSKDVSPGHLGFVVGPRINASGRIGSASLALELLTVTDQGRATELANELEALNQERATIQNQIWDQVRLRVEEGLNQGKFKHGILVADPSWHEGVVGIVASRVTETFHKPAAVLCVREDFAKGSVRSYGGKNVLEALRASQRYLLGFGGHKHAAGLTVSHEHLDMLADSFDQALGTMSSEHVIEPLLLEGECDLGDLNSKTLQEIENLGPFGPGNPEPVFSLRAKIQTHQILKGRHLKLQLTAGSSDRKSTIEAIWFHAAERADLLQDAEFFAESEWAGVPELNRFRGYATPTLRVKDRRKLNHE